MIFLYCLVLLFLLKAFVYIVNNKTDKLDPYIDKLIYHSSDLIKKLKSKWS
jgi:hypothetical protein